MNFEVKSLMGIANKKAGVRAFKFSIKKSLTKNILQKAQIYYASTSGYLCESLRPRPSDVALHFWITDFFDSVIKPCENFMRSFSFIVSSLALSFSFGISIIPVSHMGLEHVQQVQAQAATTLYVNMAKGNSAGPGNAQAPFKTITAALQAAAPWFTGV
jgi:hypothetical protein